MRKPAILILILALVPTILSAQVPEPTSVHVLMISLDGLKPDYLLRAKDLGLEIPNLRKLMAEGIVAEGVVGVLPSVTYPSHVTLMTGVPPRIHGIGSNHVLDPEDIGQDPWYWFADDIRVPTLIDAAEEMGLVTGSVSWPATIGLPADYLMPEFWRGSSRHPFDRRFMEHLSTPGLIKAVGKSRGKPIPAFPQMTDRDRTDVAKWIIATAKPDVLLVHLFDLDFAQHNHGPLSAEALSAMNDSDAYVGELLESTGKAGLAESTVVFIVSDHGFFPLHSTIAPNTLLVENGWISLDEKGKVTGWQAYFECDGGSAALVLKNEADEQLLKRIDEAVSAKAAEEGSGIYRVLRGDENRALGSSAPLVLDAASGYDFGRRMTGEWSAPTSRRGNHGQAPDRKDAYTSLVISGPLVRNRGKIGLVSMTRIAPTVASMLGLTLSPEADEPIKVHLGRAETP